MKTKTGVLPRTESYGIFVFITVIVAGLAMLQLSTSRSAECFRDAIKDGPAFSLGSACGWVLDGPGEVTYAESEPLTATDAHAAHLAFVSLMSLAIATSVGGAAMAMHLATEPREAEGPRPWRQRSEITGHRLVARGDWRVSVFAACLGIVAIAGMLIWNPTEFTIRWNPYGWEHHLTKMLAVMLGTSAISVVVIIAIGHRVSHIETAPTLRHLLNAKWASVQLLAVFAATLSLGILAMSARWRMGEFLPGGEPVPAVVAVLYGALFSLVLAALAFPTQSRLNAALNVFVNGESGGTDVAFTVAQAEDRRVIRRELSHSWGGGSLLPSSVSVAGPIITAAATTFLG